MISASLSPLELAGYRQIGADQGSMLVGAA
jgi:hypothetical protein